MARPKSCQGLRVVFYRDAEGNVPVWRFQTRTFGLHWSGSVFSSKTLTHIRTWRNEHGNTQAQRHIRRRTNSVSPLLQRTAQAAKGATGGTDGRYCGAKAHSPPPECRCYTTAIGQVGGDDCFRYLPARGRRVCRTLSCHAESNRFRIEAPCGNSFCSRRRKQGAQISLRAINSPFIFSPPSRSPFSDIRGHARP
jgi:hypothetical protein